MTHPIDWTKPVEFVTAAGHAFPARVVCTDARSGEPIIALVSDDAESAEVVRQFHEDGSTFNQPGAHLRNVRVRREGFVNVYSYGVTNRCSMFIYDSVEDARKVVSDDDHRALAVAVPISWDETP